MSRALFRWVALALVVSATGCTSVYLEGTPFYEGSAHEPQGPSEQRVNLWPIAYYQEPALSVLWPLMEWTDDHVAVRPVFSVYDLDKPKHEWNVLPPLAQFSFPTDDYRVFPLFWGKHPSGKRYLVAAPLLWWHVDPAEVLNELPWELAWPYPSFEYGGDACQALFPLWIYYPWGEGEYDAYAFWPVFNLRRTKDERGWRLWPLAGDYKSEGERYRYALWPLCHEWREGDWVTRVVAPFYFEYGGKNLAGEEFRWRLLVPVALSSRSKDSSLLLTPLWSAGEAGGERWSALIPLYYHSADASGGTTRLLTPLVGRLRSPARTRWIIVPLASSVAWGEGERDLWFLAPLVHVGWDKRDLSHHVVPIYYYESFDRGADRALFTPLVSWGKGEDRRFWNLGGLLAHYSRERDGHTALSLLMPLSRFAWGGPQGAARQARVLPLFSWEKGPASRMAWKDTDGRTTAVETEWESLWLPPWTRSERHRAVRYRPEGSSAETRIEASRDFSSFPFWDSQSFTVIEGMKAPVRSGNFRLLGWLYDREFGEGTQDEKDPAKTHDYVCSRLLWRVMHYERRDGNESLDVFPFITWDRKADGYRKASFVWRLYRDERAADGARKLDLLFIPLLRRPGKQERDPKV